MKQKICLLVFALFILSQIGAINTVEAENNCSNNNPPTIFFSEIGWAGSSKSTIDEWLELANLGQTTIDLSGWIIEGAGTSGAPLLLSEGSQIPPRSVYLIANYSSESDKSILASPPNYITSSISLSNSSLQLILKDGSGCEIDRAGDGGSPFFGGTGTNKAVSMVRLELLTNGSISTSWTAAETSLGFDAGALDLGTPGTLVENLPTPTEEIVELEETSLNPTQNTEVVEETVVSETTETTIVENETTEPTTIDETVIDEKNLISSTETVIDNNTTTVEETSVSANETETESVTKEEPGPSLTVEKDLAVETDTSEETLELIEETTPTTETASVIVANNSAISIFYPQGTLIINEFVADPISGEKEWVEIKNPYNNVIPLNGWRVSESSGKTASLPDMWLGFEQLIVVEFSSGVLNNGGDEIFLLDPGGQIIDSVVYGTEEISAVSDPNSTARNSHGKFVLTETPTRGLENVITKTEEISLDSTQNTEVAETTPAPKVSEIKTTVENTEETEETVEETPKTDPPIIRLSEIYPNTDGSDSTDEFIELENYGPTTADLSGLVFEDAVGNKWTLPGQTNLEAGAFLATKRTAYKFALNNSGSETVRLYAVDGSLLDQIQYENAPKKFTYARDGNVWRWTTNPTPNEPNSFPQTVESEDNGVVRQTEASVDSQRTTTTKSPARVNIAEARALKLDSQIITTGIVSVAPNILGKQIFYLSDNAVGIQIYKSDGNFPELALGDRLELTGTISSNRSEPRIKIGKDDVITILENNVSLAVLDTSTIDEKNAGQLVRVSGLVTEKSNGQITIETTVEILEIKIKNDTGIDLAEVKPGSKVTVVGIVGQTEKNFYLLPRSPEDIVLEKTESSLLTTIEPTGKETAKKSKQSMAIIIGLGVIATLIIYNLRKHWPINLKKYGKIEKLSFEPAKQF